MHRRCLGCGRPGFVVRSAASPLLGSSKYALEDNDGVMIDDRGVPAALAAFYNISAAGAMVDGVECAGSCCDGRVAAMLKREKWACFGSTEADR